MTNRLQEQLVVYQGQPIGVFQYGALRPTISESELVDLIEELEPEQRVHLSRAAPPLHALAQVYGLQPQDYTGLFDLTITATGEGCRTVRDVRKKDPIIIALANEMHVADRFRYKLQHV